jgi:hypothetical protein
MSQAAIHAVWIGLCARHDGKFARLSFSLVGRKVMGKKAAGGTEEEEIDWNAIFNTLV